jgi:TrmH family RNA methyltransferase
MLRTADALGAAFIGSGLTTDLTNPNVIRAAQGSLLAMPTATSSSEEAASWAAEHTNVYVLRPRDSVSLWETDLTGATSVVIGSEADGVGQAWRGVGVGVSIPMSGSADSLNASVTAGIVLAEATRQRLTGTSTT